MPQQPRKDTPANRAERDIAQERAPGAGEARKPAKQDIVRRHAKGEHPVK